MVVVHDHMNQPGRRAVIVVLFLFATAFIALTVSSYVQKSGTSDEPSHLTAGYLALKWGDYRIDVEHPPVVHMWTALPLLLTSGVTVNTNNQFWATRHFWDFDVQFLYKQNDADRLLYRARFMTVLLGVLLGALLFSWATELFGFWPATVVLGLYMLEPNILAHSCLVTTDLGVTCFMFGAVYFLWRTCRRLSVGNLAGLVGFTALALTTKFSAVLLVPIMLALLIARACQRKPWLVAWRRDWVCVTRPQRFMAASLVLVLLAAGAAVFIWGVYRFHYAPAPASVDPNSLMRPKTRVAELVPKLTTLVDWVDQHRLLPNAYSQGFLLGQGKAQHRPAFLAGRFSDTGWWYYFPVVILLKTPITLLALCVGGLTLCVIRWKTFFAGKMFILVPIAIYLGVAMTSRINIGLRHILPIYPFLLLLAGETVAALQARVRPAFLLVLLIPAAVELATVAPHYLAFFNQFAGGPGNGHNLLVDSNLDWGQDLKPLKKWMDKNCGAQRINLAYFGNADPAYYDIRCTYLPGSPFFAKDKIEGPWIPGYVAVSVNNLHNAADETVRAFYKPLLEREPVAVIGYSIRVYRVDRAWW
jgi:hypothetical protein